MFCKVFIRIFGIQNVAANNLTTRCKICMKLRSKLFSFIWKIIRFLIIIDITSKCYTHSSYLFDLYDNQSDRITEVYHNHIQLTCIILEDIVALGLHGPSAYFMSY